MKNFLIITYIVSALLGFAFAGVAQAATHVRGYVRHNGTYVQPHYRSNSDGIKSNNWSSWGNYNPFTGKRGYRRW